MLKFRSTRMSLSIFSPKSPWIKFLQLVILRNSLDAAAAAEATHITSKPINRHNIYEIVSAPRAIVTQERGLAPSVVAIQTTRGARDQENFPAPGILFYDAKIMT